LIEDDQIKELSDFEPEEIEHEREMRDFLKYSDLERSKSDPTIIKRFQQLKRQSLQKYKSKMLR
jgi:hypothetical protein